MRMRHGKLEYWEYVGLRHGNVGFEMQDGSRVGVCLGRWCGCRKPWVRAGHVRGPLLTPLGSVSAIKAVGKRACVLELLYGCVGHV